MSFILAKVRFFNFKFLYYFQKGLKNDFYSILKAFFKTYEYLLVTVSVMIVYALIGVFFFRGAIENRCRTTPYPANDFWQISDVIENLCGSYECPNKLNNI